MENNLTGVFVKDPENRQWYCVPPEEREVFYQAVEDYERDDLSVDEVEELFAHFMARFGKYQTKHPVHYVVQIIRER